jgi:hypothetical protein
MSRFIRTIAYALALNFLITIGGAGYLWRTGHLNKDRATAIKAILFPAPTTQPSATGAIATTEPSVQLGQLIQKAAGLSPEQQVDFLERSFDERMAQLDLRQRELSDQQRQLDFGQQKLGEDRAALDKETKALTDREALAAKLASDQGFQDSLQLYEAMPARQVKTIFAGLSDDVVERYLEAMDVGTASKIIKEFKTPDETNRIQKVLERMRQPPVAAAGAG